MSLFFPLHPPLLGAIAGAWGQSESKRGPLVGGHSTTPVNESGKWHLHAIERALAHGDSDRVRAALPSRRPLEGARCHGAMVERPPRHAAEGDAGRADQVGQAVLEEEDRNSSTIRERLTNFDYMSDS